MGFKISKILVWLLLIFILYTKQCYAINVGDSYGGGTVFCVSDTPDTSKCKTEGSGDYGLIMANEDQVNYLSNSKHGITWSKEYSVTNAQSRNDGATNKVVGITIGIYHLYMN